MTIKRTILLFGIIFIYSKGLAQIPTISGFTPKNGPIGSTVVITGNNYSGTITDNVVFFGPVKATVTQAATNELTVEVPVGATYNQIRVTVNSLTVITNDFFTVTFSNGGKITTNAFSSRVDFTPQVGGGLDVEAFDINGDGKVELLTSSGGFTQFPTIALYRNSGASGNINSSTFPSRSDITFTSSSFPNAAFYDMDYADFDGDGKQDLVVTNSFGADYVTVFRNSGSSVVSSASFGPRNNFTAGNSPWGVAVGDLDGDGMIDFVVSNRSSNTISIFRNTGSPFNISFAPKVDFATSDAPGYLAIRDLDGDGKNDIVVTNYATNNVSVYRNVSSSGSITTSSFLARIDFATGTQPNWMTVADVDGDSKQDIIVSNGTGDNTLSILRNTSTPGVIGASSFAAQVSFARPPSARGIDLGDINGDGKVDIVVTSNTIGIIQNQSTSGFIDANTFAALVEIPFAGGFNVKIGDYDGDGKPDIASTDQTNSLLSVFRNKMAEPPVITSFSPTVGPIGSSVTITGSNFFSTATDNIVFFGGVKAQITSASSTQLIVTVPKGASYQPISVTTNGLTGVSNKPFTVTFSSSNTLNGNTFFNVRKSYQSNSSSASQSTARNIVSSDLDGDGKIEIIASANLFANEFAVLRNQAVNGIIDASTFNSPTLFSMPAVTLFSKVVDFDNDGKKDIIVKSENVSMLKNNTTSGITTSNFSPSVDFNLSTLSDINFADIDQDGKLDLITTNGGKVSIYKNIGISGTIAINDLASPVDFNTSASNIAVADLDMDGWPDIVVTNGTGVSVFRNNQVKGEINATSLNTKADFVAGLTPKEIAIGDIDMDGRPEIMVTNTGSNTFSVFRNISSLGSLTTSSFSNGVEFFTNSAPFGIAVGDLTGDGKPEVAVTNFSDNSVSVYKNNSTSGSINLSTFSNKIDYPSFENGAATGAPISVNIEDYDLDGRPDIATGGAYAFFGSAVSVLQNNILAPEPASAPTALTFPTLGVSGYFVSFTATTADGYLVLQRVAASPTGTPLDGTSYTLGNTIGDGTVVAVGANTNFTASALTANTVYHFDVIAYNGSGNTINYNTVNRLEGSRTTLQTEPAAQPTALSFSNVTINSQDASFTAASGVDGYVVLRRAGAAPTFVPVDGTVYTAGTTQGDADVISVGSAISFNNTSLTANIVYHYAVYSYRGAGAATNYLNTSPLSGNRATLVNEPASAPTVLTFPTFTITSLGGSFTATTADGYLILQRATSSPTGTPVDGTTYTVGNTIGDGTVVAVGAGNTFTASSLTTNTVYHYDVIAYNGSGNIINYNTASRLEGSRTTLQTEPAAQPTALSFANVTINSQDASFTAAGGVDGYVVLRRSGSAPTFVPADGTVYTAGTTQGDAQVISVGSAVSFNNTSLTANTVYHYAVYSYRGAGAATNYLTTSPLSGNRSTLASEPATAPTSLTFSTFTTTSLGGSFTVTTADGYLVLQRATDSPTGTPIDGTSYTVGNTIGDGTVVALGTGTTFTTSSLTANTVYHYDVIAYNGSGNIINYNTTARLEGSRTTLQTEPTAQPTAITFNNITIASLGSSFTAATGSPEGYIVFRRQGSAPTFTPVDGTTYSSGAQGDAVVVSSSAGTTFTDAGLVAGTVYHYAVYAFNGAGQAINYRTSSPLANSVITISAAPSATAATLPTQTSFVANWSAVTGAASYSLDVSQDNFSNLLPTYSSKSVGGLSDAVTGLTPGTSYQYRVRAVNASGLSDNSNTIIQKTIPQTPTALQPQPTAIRSNDFTAVWSASPGADNYELDVSQNNFVTFITGFQSKSIPAGVTEEIVTGLSPTTPYQYRVRARNTAGPSTSSNEITVTTTAVGGTAPLAISGTQAPQGILSSSGPLAVTTTVSGGSGTKAVKLFYRGIVANNFIELNMGNPQGNNTYEVNIPAAAADQLGVEFYIRAQAGAEVIQTNRNFIYKTFSASEATAIPSITLSGGTLETYQIISIPLQLEDNLISSVFEPALGAYDKTKWRLVRFQNGRNTDYQAGLTRINQGESYWFNSVDPVSVKPGEATTPRYNQSNPFVLKLAQGWNQIATPYPFSINWDDVLDDPSNNNPSGIGKYRVYVPESASFADSNTLQPYSGGFVFADPARDLILPVTLNNPSGGRKATNTISSDLGNEEWMVPITLSQGKAFNMFGAVGMHPQASPGKDDFDDITLPRFIKHLEFNSYHEEFIVPRFSKDIVPTSNKHVWDIAIESNFDEGPITLSWEGIDFGSSESQLILFDQAAGVLIDMKKNSSYQLHNSTRHDIQFIYHRDKKIDVSNTLLLGKPFPNPSAGEVTFNLFSATPINGQLEIVDMMGKKMITTGFSLDGEYVKTLRWSGAMPNEMPVAAGVYIYQIVTSSKTIQGRIIIK